MNKFKVIKMNKICKKIEYEKKYKYKYTYNIYIKYKFLFSI
jgi:hypothetical protein